MFGLFKKDPKKKLEQEYAELLTKAVEAQRNGKIELYGQLTFQSEEVLKKIEELNCSHSTEAIEYKKSPK